MKSDLINSVKRVQDKLAAKAKPKKAATRKAAKAKTAPKAKATAKDE